MDEGSSAAGSGGKPEGEGRLSTGDVLLALWLSANLPPAPGMLSPVFVYQGIEGQAVLPAGGEVGYVDMGVAAVRETLRLRNQFF